MFVTKNITEIEVVDLYYMEDSNHTGVINISLLLIDYN